MPPQEAIPIRLLAWFNPECAARIDKVDHHLLCASRYRHLISAHCRFRGTPRDRSLDHVGMTVSNFAGLWSVMAFKIALVAPDAVTTHFVLRRNLMLRGNDPSGPQNIKKVVELAWMQVFDRLGKLGV